MTRIKLISFFFLTLSLTTSGQTVDSISKDKENADKNFNCNSYHNWLGLYRSRCYFKNGKKCSRGNDNIFRVLHTKTWDEQGRLIRKSKQYPFGSTSYTYTYREKTYDSNGHLIKYEFTKRFTSCFRSDIIIWQTINEYDDKGNIVNHIIDFKELIRKKNYIKNNFSSAKKYLKIVSLFLCVLPFPLIGLVYNFAKASPEIFLIPKNYQGEIIVIFDQENGMPVKYLNNKRIYEIPNNGILFTKFTWNPGFNNRNFFYLNNGEMIKIDQLNSNYLNKIGEADSNIINIIDKGPYFYRDSNTDKYLFRADQFIISFRKNIDKYSVESKMNSMIEKEFN